MSVCRGLGTSLLLSPLPERLSTGPADLLGGGGSLEVGAGDLAGVCLALRAWPN